MHSCCGNALPIGTQINESILPVGCLHCAREVLQSPWHQIDGKRTEYDTHWLPLQGYISLLDEDLGKAQERIGSVLADDDNSSAKQNEMLKAAAKQVRLLQNVFSMPFVCHLALSECECAAVVLLMQAVLSAIVAVLAAADQLPAKLYCLQHWQLM